MTQPIAPDAWPEALADLEDAFAGQLNVYRTMAHHPALVRAWADLRQHIVLDTSLGRERSEVVILRAAKHMKSNYEWTHHVHRAGTLGISNARIASLLGLLSEMEPDDAVIACAVDDLMDHKRLLPATQAALHALVGDHGCFDLFATVGFYSTLAFIVNTHHTPLDADVADEIAGHPLAAPFEDPHP